MSKTKEVKYTYGDTVVFDYHSKSSLRGEIAIIDRFGTFGQNEEPSYDILVFDDESNEKVLYKHVRQSWINNSK